MHLYFTNTRLKIKIFSEAHNQDKIHLNCCLTMCNNLLCQYLKSFRGLVESQLISC